MGWDTNFREIIGKEIKNFPFNFPAVDRNYYLS